MIKIIDTFNEFAACFCDKLNADVEEKLDIWNKCYISKYPELEEKLKGDYESNGYSWRDIARNMVFIRTRDDFNRMKEAHTNILEVMESINSRVSTVFNVDPDLNIVLYCGLLNSAGWVNSYGGIRAILYGIDKIAELKWHTREQLEALTSHELCHVVHFELRGEDSLPEGVEKNSYNIGIWNIYEEGFAQYYQQKLMGKNTDSRGEEWFKKCRELEQDLRKLYYEALFDEEKGTRDFFGDWFNILDISDAGYFLGAELIGQLDKELGVKKAACMPFSEIEARVIDFLVKQ